MRRRKRKKQFRFDRVQCSAYIRVSVPVCHLLTRKNNRWYLWSKFSMYWYRFVVDFEWWQLVGRRNDDDDDHHEEDHCPRFYSIIVKEMLEIPKDHRNYWWSLPLEDRWSDDREDFFRFTIIMQWMDGMKGRIGFSWWLSRIAWWIMMLIMGISSTHETFFSTMANACSCFSIGKNVIGEFLRSEKFLRKKWKARSRLWCCSDIHRIGSW